MRETGPSNGTQPGEPAPDALVHERFAAGASGSPRALALLCGEREVTYAVLDREANRLAHHLREAGVGPGTMVGLMIERSPEMVTALVAVLKAGGAYVPMDPAYPAQRLRFLAGDLRRAHRHGAERQGAGPTLVVTQERFVGQLPDGVRPVVVDREGAAIDARPIVPPPPPHATAADLAYVIYTSGSTGQPKGVAIAHRGVASVIREAVRAFGVGPGSRVLQLASLSFDASVLEIFMALTSGATLCLPARGGLTVGGELGRELRRRRITHLAIPPSLLDTVPPGRYPDLASIVVGGEAVSAETANRWLAGRRFFNVYAPTETTIFSTLKLCADTSHEPPPLGDAIAGTEVRLLGPGLGETAPGGVGEIAIAGEVLARGYLNRPGLTAEIFVPDPRASAPGGRLYRSGDLARYLSGGELTFAGRADNQVKVRGFRIELGEVEAVLRQHPAVHETVVLAREDVPGSRWLVAYVVRRDAGRRDAVTADELLAHARATLPAHMAPAKVVFLERFPVTDHGKLDRDALPAPERAGGDGAPRTPLEETLAEIWAELLGLGNVGLRDNLFELGGHSLLVAQIVARLRQRLGVDLSPIDVFTAPTVEGLAERVEKARDEMAAELPRVEHTPRGARLPLSFPQEQVWFLNQLSPGNLAYNFQFTLRFRGPLDANALRRALQEIVRRHEVLRTTFPLRGSAPVQEIHPPFEVRLPIEDVSSEAAAEDRVGELVRRPFDVERLPLVDWTLLRLGPEDHLYVHVEHHFVHDGWSLGVYLGELTALYEAFAAGRPSPLAELPWQFADFAVWQRRAVSGELLRRQLDYWRERLESVPAPLELPADRPRPEILSLRGAARRVDLPPELYAALRAFCRRHGVTLFMVMLGAFEALLVRATSQRRFLLGSGVANRRLRESECLIGMIVNTVLIDADLRAPDGAATSDGPTFRELLRQVHRSTLAALQNQDLPFEKLVEELHPERDTSRNPLFQALFSFHDSPVPDLDVADLEIELFERHNGSAKADLNVVVKPRAEQRVGRRAAREDEILTMVWEHSSDVFDPTTIHRLLAHFQTLLGAVTSEPGTRLFALPLLRPDERHQLLAEWASSDAGTPSEELFVDRLFARQAALRPAAVAATCGGAWITYGELSRRANRLAHWLRDRGVGGRGIGRDQRVAVLGHRGVGMLSVILALAKAGAAYVPLEPAHPDERLRTILADCGVGHLATESALARRAAEIAGALHFDVELFCWDHEPAEPPTPRPPGPASWAGRSEDDPASVVGPQDLVNVFYTSGSTGLPKGAMVEHEGMLCHLRGKIGLLGLDARSVIAQNASHGFDVSVWQFLAPLMSGGRLVIYDDETVSDVATFLSRVAADRITVLETVPSLLELMLATAGADLRLPSLRYLISNAETLPVGLARQWQERFPAIPLLNTYGATECSDDVTHQVFRQPLPPAAWRVHQGRPIAGMRVYVLDRRFSPVPMGWSGQIAFSGIAVGRGYFGDGVKTAQTFVPDPLSEQPGDRLYLTGDLGRFTAAAELDFLSRLGNQVKVRGHRVELGEIEAALLRHPRVRQAAAVARAGAGGQIRLLACVVGDGELSSEELRDLARRLLPAYMVPEHFTQLAALPLNSNGKVDRQALPDPPAERGEESAEHAAPRNGLERQLVAIWQEVLKLRRVGIHDNFFDLGGHSLSTVHLASEVRRAMGRHLAIREIFSHPTPAEQARVLAGRTADESQPIPRLPEQPHYPLSATQLWQFFLFQLLAEETVEDPVIVRLEGSLQVETWRAALRELVERHEILRTSFEEIDGEPRQKILPSASIGDVASPLHDLRPYAGDEQQRRRKEILAAEAGIAFDLRRPPLLRTRLVRLADEEYLAMFNMPHIVTDLWTEELLFDDLGQLYAAALTGRAATLPEPRIRYVDFAAWQQEQLATPEIEAQADFWIRRFADAPAPPAFPFAPPDAPAPRFTTLSPSSELIERVKGNAASYDATLFMALAASFMTVWSRWLGTREVVLGTAVSGRNHPDLKPLAGVFINMLPLRTELDGDPTYEELLGRVRETALAAFDHQDVPFHTWVERSRQERRQSDWMPCSVWLFYTPPQVSSRFADLRITRLSPDEWLGDLAVPATEIQGQDLVFYVEETRRDLRLTTVNTSGQFAGSVLELLLRDVVSILEQAVTEPRRRLSEMVVELPAELLRRRRAEHELEEKLFGIDPENIDLDDLDQWLDSAPVALSSKKGT